MTRQSMMRYFKAMIMAWCLTGAGCAFVCFTHYERDSRDSESIEVMKAEAKPGANLSVDQLRSLRIDAPNEDLHTREGLTIFLEVHWQRLVFAVFAGCLAIAFLVDRRSRIREASHRRMLASWPSD